MAEREAIDWRQLWLDGQHRTRNTFAVLRSIIRRSAERAETVEDLAARVDGRLGALARSQAAAWANPTTGVPLEQIVHDELATYALRDHEEPPVDGPQVRLRARAAESYGLAVHELAVNALLHGALAQPGGRLSVGWRIEAGPSETLVFEWREEGLALDRSRPPAEGFGFDYLTRGLEHEVGARTRLDLGDGGLTCIIRAPLKPLLAEPWS